MKKKYMNSSRSLALVLMIASVVTALFPFVIMPVCGPKPDGTFMVCHYSAILVGIICGGLAVINLISLLANRKWLTVCAALLTLAGSAAAYVIPARIVKVHCTPEKLYGLCKMQDMVCHSSFVWVNRLLAVAAVLAVLQLLLAMIQRQRG